MAAHTMLWSFQETWRPAASERLWDHPEMINILVCENQPQVSSLLVINESGFDCVGNILFFACMPFSPCGILCCSQSDWIFFRPVRNRTKLMITWLVCLFPPLRPGAHFPALGTACMLLLWVLIGSLLYLVFSVIGQIWTLLAKTKSRARARLAQP